MSQGARTQTSGRQQPPQPLAGTSSMAAITSQPTCAYAAYTCTRPCLEHYDYCLRHILEDRRAPYKQCSFVYGANGRRCQMPTLRTDKKDSGLCTEHARRAQLARQKSVRRRAPRLSTESLMLGLSHYVPKDDPARTPNAGTSGDGVSLNVSHSGGGDAEFQEDSELDVTKSLHPFDDIDASKVNAEMSKVLDYASESDSDLDVVTYDGTWSGPDLDSSDADSMDGTLEESSRFSAFQHAGVYTAEEAAQLTKDKLIRLQSLYIDQFRRLQQVLRIRRRRYLLSLKREKETMCSIHNQRKDSPKEVKLYRKLKALNRYQRRCGVEAILHKKSLERRAQATEGMTVRTAPTTKCVFTEGGVKCGEKTVPLAKHCMKHILQDTHQVLYRPCGRTKGGFPCREPVPGVFEDALCVYHEEMKASYRGVSHTATEQNPVVEKKFEENLQIKKERIEEIEVSLLNKQAELPIGGDKEMRSVKELSKEESVMSVPPSRQEEGGGDACSGATVAPESRIAEQNLAPERDPSESFQSETSTTDTASFEGSMENIETTEDC
ncbi:hypothetical protein R5R35_009785 [Gryllus longicercus]|uniref:KAT8 regulatory NSL complex subunit 2 n=1 Tax=Gryllus longicercus TaxID=2509291 RepID=A0AAN9Z2I2_9ORTH